nr:reverse transcriptase domain-containing protein [Tanacetum cinerariifolium]
MEVLYEHCFNRLWPEIKSQRVSATASLTGFSGETIWSLGQLRLLVTIGDTEHYTKAWMNFTIVRSPSPYNGIIGRPGIREIKAVPSTAHGMVNFPVNDGIMTICSTIMTPTECTTIAAAPKDHAKKAEARHENFKVVIHPDFLDQEITIGGTEYHDRLPSIDSISEKDIPLSDKKRGRPRSAPRQSKQRIVTPFRKSIERSNPSAATPAIIKYRWPNKMRKVRLSTLVTSDGKIFATPQNLEEMHQKSDFHWTPDVEQAFKQLKQHLAKLPMLVAPKPKEELIMYLSASYGAISAVLMTEMDTVQTPVYFVSRVLQAPELNYTPMEKLVLALVCAAKRLRRYFQAHPIVSVMLGEHNITYGPRTSVKGQILADFLVEKPDDASPKASVIKTSQEPWPLFTDGSSCVDGSGVHNVHASVDSKLVANQVLWTYVAMEENMIKYLEKAKSLISGFANFSISQVPRSKNKKADALSKIASTSFAHLSKQVLVEVLKEKSIQEEEVATVVEEDGPTWKTPIMEYLKDGTLLGDRKEASKLRSGKVKFLIVAIDYFTKWIEAKAVATITINQFSDNPFKYWCDKLNITQHFASVKHLQSNGLIERANRSLGEGIKARLSEGNKNWIEELPHVLWAHRTMIKSSHAIREAKAKLKITKYYNARVCGVTFRPGDFVYRSNEASHAMDWENLGPK